VTAQIHEQIIRTDQHISETQNLKKNSDCIDNCCVVSKIEKLLELDEITVQKRAPTKDKKKKKKSKSKPFLLKFWKNIFKCVKRKSKKLIK